jgi:signal transduction histidine kinase
VAIVDKKIVILYIEDNLANQKLVQRVLERHSYEVHIANDGLEGIALARQTNPDLILMDINLPNMDGKEITTRLRSLPHFAKTPIVALTANSSGNSRAQALAAGCNGFLTKPIDVTSFPNQVQSFLQGQVDKLSDEEQNTQLKIYTQQLVERLEGKVREMQEANERLRELDRMKSDFIVLVSHELRTPLTIINGYSDLLKQTQTDPNTQLAFIVGGLTKGIERLSQVVAEIISVSRIAAGTLELALGPVRLSDTVNAIVKEQKATIEERGMSVTVEDLAQLPLIQADGTQLRTAIENVVVNAIKYTPDKGRVTIRGKVVPNAVVITVEDTGIGVPLEEQRRIFEHFHILGSIQHHSTSKSNFKGGGLGVGLAIARGIVEAHQGRIWVESERRDMENPPGSKFHILLPLHPSLMPSKKL